MTKANHSTVRALLREHSDGLTVAQIAQLSGLGTASLTRTLQTMPDVYRDRWIGPKRGQWSAVWCAVVPPPDCPHPDENR